MFQRLKQFITEEQGQVSIEYYILVGAAMVTAVMFASSYRKMAYGSEYTYSREIQSTQETLCEYIEEYLESEFDVCN